MKERTPEIAAEYLEHYKKVKYGMMPEWVWDMAIKALKQEPCEDAIDRKYLTGLMFTEADLSDAHTCYESIRKIVEEMPSVTLIRPKGHWEDACGNLKCPYCETEVSDVKVFSPLTKYTNACWFCPICGADMRGSEND